MRCGSTDFQDIQCLRLTLGRAGHANFACSFGVQELTNISFSQDVSGTRLSEYVVKKKMEVESKEADIYVNYSRSQPDNIVVVSSDFTYEMKQLAMNAS
jgi:hypothetical protein